MGSSWSPPASWCKRFNVDNAWLKSERFLTGWVSFPDLLRDPPILHVVKVFCFWHSVGVILFCKNIPCSTNCFISIVLDHSFKENMISQESVIGFRCSPSLCISFSSYWPDNILCFLEVCHICSRDVFPSLWRILELKEDPMYFQWNFDWPLFLLRDAGMCNRRCLHSSMIGILCTAS